MLPPAPVSPRRYTCIAYADIDTVYLVFPSSPPRALFFVVTVEVIPSGRNPLPGIFKLSKYEIAHQARGIESPDRLPQPSASTYIRIRLSLPFPGSCPVHLVLSHSWLTRIATIRTNPSLSWVTLVTAPTPVTGGLLSLPLANSHQRDPWDRSRGMCRYPRFFPSFSRILWSIRNLANLRILRQTRRRQSFKRRKFCPRSKDVYLISCRCYIVCKLFVAARNPSFETIPRWRSI